MTLAGQRFCALPGLYAVCRLSPEAAVPGWAGGSFCSVTRTADELSVICAAGQVPADVCAERDWRVLKITGPFPFSATGVLASFASPLADAGISLLAVATYETDYVLVKAPAFERAVAVLVAAGHQPAG